MEKYCGSRYKSHFRKNRRRKRASMRSLRVVNSCTRLSSARADGRKSAGIQSRTKFRAISGRTKKNGTFRSFMNEGRGRVFRLDSEEAKGCCRTMEIGQAIGLSLRSSGLLCLMVLLALVALRVQYTANKNVGCLNVLSFALGERIASIVCSKFQFVHVQRWYNVEKLGSNRVESARSGDNRIVRKEFFIVQEIYLCLNKTL